MNKEILNVKELAKYLGVSETVAYRLTHTDGFPILRVGKRYLIPMVELREWISKNTER